MVVYGNIVDVVARKVYPGRVTLCDRKIVSIEAVSADDEHACRCVNYILPGFVDSHIHIESTLMIPRNYARMAVSSSISTEHECGTLVFMALPVIPDLKLTDKGLFDGVSFSFTSVWEGSTN